MKPLENIRVLDLTQFLSGPFCTCILEDLGAEVIKCENPNMGGDSNRYTNPMIDRKSSYHMSTNRGKKSVLTDFKNDKIRALFLEAVKDADVVVENYKPGTMEKLGIGYETLKSVKPDIILASISGYGQTGPWGKRAAFDAAVQAISGIMSLTGAIDGDPQKVGVSISDIMGGMWGAIGTLGALYRRSISGEGAHVDVAMLDGTLIIQDVPAAAYFLTGKTPERLGNGSRTDCPFQPFPCKNEEMVFICCPLQPSFISLCQGLGHPELAEDERFMSPPSRYDHREELTALLTEITRQWDAKDLCAMLEERNLTHSMINTLPQVLEMEQVKSREMIANVHWDGDDRDYHVLATPVHMDKMDRTLDYRMSALGENTFELFSKYADEKTLHEIFDPYYEKLDEVVEAQLQ